MAQDMILGLSCSYCGVYFEKANGCPVLCTSCWDEGDNLDHKMFSKTQIKEL